MRTTKLAANKGLQDGGFIGFEFGRVDWLVKSEELIEDHKVGHNWGRQIVVRNDQMVSDWVQRIQFEARCRFDCVIFCVRTWLALCVFKKSPRDRVRDLGPKGLFLDSPKEA